jgi:hypothetical protein
VADLLALSAAIVGVALDDQVIAGAVAIAVVVVVQRGMARRTAPSAMVLGMRQMGLGFGVVAVTALGVLTS